METYTTLEAKIKKQKLSIFKLFHLSLALIVIAWLNNGTFTFIMPYVVNYLRWGLFFVWFGLAILNRRTFLKTIILQLWPLLLFNLYLIIISGFVENELGVYIKSISYLMIVYSIFLFYVDEKNKWLQKCLIVFLFLDTIIVAINTHNAIKANPLIARLLATGGETRDILIGTDTFYGIGTYGYFYSLGSLILLFCFAFFTFRKNRYLQILIIIAFMALLIEASFTIAILLTSLFLFIIIILKATNKYVLISILILGLTILLTLQGAIASLFEALANINGISNVVSVRFIELSQFFSGNNISGSDMNIRNQLYYQSLEAFINNIMTGTVFTSNSMFRAGGHSAWLDLLANFGLFSIPFFIFLIKAYNYCNSKVPLKYKPLVRIYWLYYVLLGFINTLFASNIFITWFFLLPLSIVAFFDLKSTKGLSNSKE
ncbi:hypothetical protein RCG19_07780 [Neobacillus sp. OS1-2]|uniref:hypothetical protein n=1 Tax=Neobacillus sp. OS1-2 TaxID=3070680 RepID=UPI0027DFEBB0|nr:hypothetical protein [Neobacillus sp. OS1-2]WML41538.1 hypothetical protein RCG19_07780 [Neobacillus sp. OS1-2]